MKFSVGVHVFPVRITNLPLLNESGQECWAITNPKAQEIVLSNDVPPDRRCSVLRHEFWHCVNLVLPPPQDEEQGAILFAHAAEAFDEQLQAQGGVKALIELKPKEEKDASDAAPAGRKPSDPAMGITDRVECGCCRASIMAGSIYSDPPAYVENAKTWTIRRACECDGCGAVTVWHEQCDESGLPLGVIMQMPRPAVCHGAEGSRVIRVMRERMASI